jgi:hypothetical protein
MIIKLNLSVPTLVFNATSIQIDTSMSSTELADWVFKNKKQLLKDAGCNLSDDEIDRIIALGAANIKIKE